MRCISYDGIRWWSNVTLVHISVIMNRNPSWITKLMFTAVTACVPLLKHMQSIIILYTGWVIFRLHTTNPLTQSQIGVDSPFPTAAKGGVALPRSRSSLRKSSSLYLANIGRSSACRATSPSLWIRATRFSRLVKSACPTENSKPIRYNTKPIRASAHVSQKQCLERGSTPPNKESVLH